MTGRVFAVVGPSGAGKDTLLAGAIAASPRLYWARRTITRPESAGGEPFEGVTPAQFAALSATGAFALQWPAHGLLYAVRTTEFTPLAQGTDVLFNGSRAALGVAAHRFPTLTIIRITAPSKVLAERLSARGRETPAQIEARLQRGAFDLPDGLPVIDIANDSTPATGVERLLTALQERV